MPDMKKNKKSRKAALPSLTPLEETALRLYHSGKITIEDYRTMVECKPVEDAPAEDLFNTSERSFPPPPPPPELIDDDQKAVEEIDDYMNGEPEPSAEPPRESDWVMPSPPPDNLPGEEDKQTTTEVVIESEESGKQESGNKVDKCYLWCFRCPPQFATHEITFGDGKLPDWLEFKDSQDKPPFIPICCGQCNREWRDRGDSREDEEYNIRKGFFYLKTNWHAFSEKARAMAAVRAGEGVTLFRKDGKIAHVDIDLFRSNLRRCDGGETLDLELFCEDSTGNFGTDCAQARLPHWRHYDQQATDGHFGWKKVDAPTAFAEYRSWPLTTVHSIPGHHSAFARKHRYAVPPPQVQKHLRARHPQLSKVERRRIVTAVRQCARLAYKEADVVYPRSDDEPVEGFSLHHDGVACRAELQCGESCNKVYQTIYRMQEHCKEQHSWTNVQKRGGDAQTKLKHSSNKLWDINCTYQQFFRVPGWKHCFEVGRQRKFLVDHGRRPEPQLLSFFQLQKVDIQEAKGDAISEANTVQGFNEHRSAVVPWLRTTGIVDHLQGLKKDEIRTATALPSEEEESVLSTIVNEMENVLREAHSWCFDGSECMLTWPCRVILSRFQSSQIEIMGRTRAFDHHKEPGSLKKYIQLAKRSLAYIDRVACGRDFHFTIRQHEETTRPEDVMELTVEQRQTWHTIRRLARQREAGDGGDEDGLKARLIEMWMLLIRHETGARRYRSPLLSFCAMLSIKQSTSSWMEPGNFNSHLSALIWVVQLLIFFHSARQERNGEGETLQLVKRTCDECLQQTVETPMGEILRWRLLLFDVAGETVGTNQASWDEDEQILTYEDTELHMSHVPMLLESEYGRCRRLLYDDLMFGVKEFRPMRAWELKDNYAVDIVDWSFTQHRENEHLLRGSENLLLNAIEQSPRLCELYLVENSDAPSGYVWRESALASYMHTVQEFLHSLAVLFHMYNGTPIRESEFLSMTWRNTQRKRNITLLHSRVMIHVTYNKRQQQTGKGRDNIRFLARPFENLLLDYIAYVTHLQQNFLRQSSAKKRLSPYLWARDGIVWPDGQLSRCMESASARAGIPRLHISNWRQMTVAFVKTKFASDIGCFEFDPNDEDAEEIDDDVRILTRQRNHKTRTVNRAYANQTGAVFGNVWDGLVRMGLRASTLWHDFWGVETVLADKKRLRDEETHRLSKRIAMGIYRPRKPWSADALEGAMRKLYKDEEMSWKSAEQRNALIAIMSWTEQIVAILPTGAGKSLLFMVPCTLPDAGITIVVVPLIALRGDLVRRLQELQIDHLEWLPGERREARLVLVSVEAAATKDFLVYAQALVAQQKLDRVVLDECHLTVTAAEYRPSIIDMTMIRTLRTQFVYLTATLPPSMQVEFEERNYLLHPRIIRASSNRSNLLYVVRRAEPGKGSLLEQAAAEVQDAWLQSGLFDMTRDKIIIYVRTRNEARDLASMLNCDSYIAESGSPDEKKELLIRWTRSPEHPFIVATTALAEGFDYPHVRFVINVNEPDSLIVFAQESGRAGRDGQRAYSLVLLPANWNPPQEPTADSVVEGSSVQDASLRKLRERRAVHRYLKGQQCYRTSLTEYLDAPGHRRWCMMEDVACDVCGSGHVAIVPPPQQSKATKRHTGFDLVLQERLKAESELERYREDLAAVGGTCLLCRGMERRWDHPFVDCADRQVMFQERKKARSRCEGRGRQWLKSFTACFWCLNPQTICQRADTERDDRAKGCEYGDMVLPLCHGVFQSMWGEGWLMEHFGRKFGDVEDFYDWLGEESKFGGGRAIQAVRVTALALQRFRLT